MVHPPPPDCSVDEVSRAELDLGYRLTRVAAWVTARKAKYTAGAAIVLVDGNNQMLLVKQRYRERDRWGLPSGFQNRRESPVAAALRELKQETGVAVPIEALTFRSVCKQSWFAHFESLYEVKLDYTPTLKAKFSRYGEIVTAGWHQVDNLPPLTLPATHSIERHWGPSRGH